MWAGDLSQWPGSILGRMCTHVMSLGDILNYSIMILHVFGHYCVYNEMNGINGLAND